MRKPMKNSRISGIWFDTVSPFLYNGNKQVRNLLLYLLREWKTWHRKFF